MLPVQHDRGDVGDAEHLVGELLDDQDRHVVGGDALHDLVELLDTTSGASPIDSSSSRSTFGSVAIARAIASICCSPPESVPAICLRRSLRRGNRANAAPRPLTASGPV